MHFWPNHETSVGGVPAVGWDLASAHTQFVANMNYNWDSKLHLARTLQRNFAGLTDVELGRMTMLYVQDGGNLQHLSDLLGVYA
jgi:hypothetical protein